LNHFGFWVSFGAATLFIFSPEAILFENWPFYTWPVTALVVVTAYFFFRYEKTLQTKYAAAFFLLVTIICLTRSAFHLIYLAGCAILILLIKQPRRRDVQLYAAAAVAVVTLLFLKNFILFGFFGSSSWIGMNLWKIAENDAVSELVANNELPAMVEVPIFSPISDYSEEYQVVPEQFADVSSLANEYKANGEVNFNHYGFVRISKVYQDAAVYLITNDIPGYLKRVVKAWGIYSSPAWNYWFLDDNSAEIKGYIQIFTIAPPRFFIENDVLGISRLYNFPVSSLAVIPLALMVIMAELLLQLRTLYLTKNFQQFNFSFLFLVMTIFFLALVGNSIETGENNRFRVLTDPLLVIAAVLSVREIWFIVSEKFLKNRLGNLYYSRKT
jgi:hypothetical protein